MSNRAAERAERRRVELRNEIADAAFEVFAEKGFHATTIADIASRAGVGTGTLYRSFDNKSALLRHVVNDLLDRIGAVLGGDNAPQAASADEYREQVERIAGGLAEAMAADPRAVALVVNSVGSPEPDVTSVVRSLIDQAADLTRTYLDHGVTAGFLRADLDTIGTARAINGLVISAMLEEQRSPGSGAALIPASISLMFDGIVQPRRKR